MNDLLKSLLPGAATLLGGPLAGAAVSWIANKLGVDPNDASAITDSIKGINPLDRLKMEQDMIKWGVEEQDKMILALMADVQDARKRDSDLAKSGQYNYRSNVMFALAVALVVWLIYISWKDPSINEYVKGIFTLVLGRFLGYLDNIYNFEFGSTRASKSKDETINNLSKG